MSEAKPKEAAKKKPRRTWIIILVAVIILLCCLVSSCVGAFVYLTTSQAKKRDEIVEKADKYYNKAVDLVSKESPRWEGVGSGDVKGLQTAAEATLTSIDKAREELEKAQAEIKKIRELWFISWEKEFVDTYLRACKEGLKAADALEKLVEGVQDIGDFAENLAAAGNKLDPGLDALNDAVSQNNSRQHRTARRSAIKANQLFEETEDLLTEANSMQKDAGLESIIDYMSKLKRLAVLQKQAAEAGTAGKVGTYNRLIKQFNEAQSGLKLKKPPVLADPEGWAEDRLKGFLEELEKHADKADELQEEAEKIYQENI